MTALRFLVFSVILLTATGCRQNNLGDRLFEVIYPATEFAIPAGQTRFATFVASQPFVSTQFQEAIARAGVTAEDIDQVGGLRARVVSLTGDDFREFERVELRVCPVGRPTGCDPLDIMFSVDDLFERRLLTVDLNPGLLNFRELFLGDQMRVEVVFTAASVSTVSLQARLEWSVQAVGNLD